MKLETTLLPNGIRLVHQQVDSPVAHLGVLFNTGSRDELDHQQGLAHFYEHLIFKGTKHRKTHHILNRIEDVGGEINAYTTKEETAVYASFLKEYYARTAELLADIVKNSTLPEVEIGREKEVIMEEINSYKDSPSELIFDDFEDLLYQNHPIGRNILGTPELVKGYKRADILRFISENYATDEMVISSVGNINFKRLEPMIYRFFGDMPSKTRRVQREKFQQYRPQFNRKEMETYQCHCLIGNLAYDVYHERRLGMILFNSILGGQSMNSRLNLSLRERHGLAYSVESSYTSYSDTGLFNVYFGTEKENLDQAMRLVHKEFKQIREKSLGSLQLSKAKTRLLGQMAIASENREDVMLNIGKSYMLFHEIDDFKELNRKVEAISASDILNIANEVLAEEQLTTLIFE
ncbi:MAG: M16 family metallopeptidase [Bacteroidales bacterium]